MNTPSDPERESLLSRLGLRPLVSSVEEPAPPVDHVALRALAQDTLSESEVRAVSYKLVRYRTWGEAFLEVLRKQMLPDATRGVVEESGESRPIRPSVNDAIASYWSWETSDVWNALAAAVPVSRSDPLAPYLPQLRDVVCRDWNWTERRRDAAFRDPIVLATAIAELLDAQQQLDLPFPPALVAVALVKHGLDRLCELS